MRLSILAGVAHFLPCVLGFQAASPVEKATRMASITNGMLYKAPSFPTRGDVKHPGAALLAPIKSAESSEEWTKPRMHNTATFRTIALLSALLAAGFSSKSPIKLVPAQVLGSVHTISFATWFGTVAYTTFVAGITMFKNLPRQTFGKLQAKLFPKYFALSSFTLALQLITLKSLKAMAGKAAHSSAKALAVALLMTLINQFYLEPKSTSNMMERYELESKGGKESDRYKTLKASFGKFHGMSSLTNLIGLCAGVAHAVLLSSALIAP